MFQKVVTNILYIGGLVILGYTLGAYYGFPGKPSEYIPEIDSTLVNTKQAEIDSLVNVIEEYEKIDSVLRDSIREVVVTRTIEVDAVKKLPLDSGVLYLKHKLREFQDE